VRRFVPLLVLGLIAGCGVFNRNEGPPAPPPDANERMSGLLAVCKGTGAAAAPDYAQQDDHRAVVFEGKGDTMSIGPNRLPADWTTEFPFTELAEVDVVVCGERVAAKTVRFCDDSGGQKKAIKWHTATYSYTARSARTGKPLGKPKTIEARSRRCPTNVSVAPEYIPLDQYALISKSALERFAKRYVED
jgi:hypothetical protein